MFEFVRKQKWILTELKYINMLGVVGALTFFSDALQSKLGTIFISRTSGTEIGNKVSALFIGQAVMGCTGYVVAQGLAAGVSTLCSQAYGAGNYKLMGVYFMRALTLASLSCFPIWTIWVSVEPVIYYFTLNSEFAKGAGDYTVILCFSYPAYIYSRLACNFLQSQNILLPIFAIQVTGNILNIGLQYLLVVVFSLEIKGVALSYVVSTYLIAILIYTYFRFTNAHLTYSTFSWAYFSQWSHFLNYGIVGTFQFILDVFTARVGPIIFLGFILKDTEQVALLGIFNVVWTLFMAFSYGFGIGANVRVANLLGENRLKRAKRTIIVITSFIFAIETTFGILLFALSHYVSYMFTSVEEMREQIEFGIRIVSVCLVADIECTLRGVCNACCLQGLILVVKFIYTVPIAYSLGCLLAYFVSWRSAGYSLFLAFGLLISAITYAFILYCYSWDKIYARVVRNTLQYSTGEPSEERSDLLQKGPLPKVKCLLVLKYAAILLVSSIVFVVVLMIPAQYY